MKKGVAQSESADIKKRSAGSARSRNTSAAAGQVLPKGAEVRKVRRNRRSDSTIEKILTASEEVILQSGADRVFILDVCHEAGISRGTFYRYFSSQEDLLDAFSRYQRDRFHNALSEATAAYDDPDERFLAFVRFVDDYLENDRVRRLLIVAPDYAMRWFQRNFHDSMIRFQNALGVVFDAWEARLGVLLDRELICELIVRYTLSDVLVPAGPERRNLPRRIERLITMLLSGRISRR